MNEDTQTRLNTAKRVEQSAHAVAEQARLAAVSTVARELPDRLDQRAKKIALNEPAVAQDLGKEGIRALRDELRAAALELGRKLISQGPTEIPWPTTDGPRGKISTREVHSAFASYLDGAMDTLVAIIENQGFTVERSVRGDQHLLLPQYLYDQDGFADVADALTRLHEATFARARAENIHGQNMVSDLWD